MLGAVGTRHFCFRSWVVGLGVVVGFTAVSALAEDQQPRTSGILSLDRLDAYLEFEAELQRTRVELDNRRGFNRDYRQKNRDYRFEERVGFALDGAVIDPSVITFGGEFAFALTQDRFEERIGRFTEVEDDTGHLLTFDMRMDFLPGKKLSGSAYGLRQDDRINRRFQPTLDRRRTGFGANVDWADDVFPMRFTYDYLETDREGNADDFDDEFFTESTFFYNVDWLISEHSTVTLSYEHSDRQEEFQGAGTSYETTRDLLILDGRFAFGSEYQHEYKTLIHWQEESGDFARDFLEIGRELSLRHSENLQTIYRIQSNFEEYEGFDVDTHRADFQLIHQMYTNLTTTVDVFGLYEDVEDDVETVQYGAGVDWQYNRGNDYGRLYANLALAYDTEDVEGNDGRRIVLDESHTFRDPVDVTLRNRNVVPTSIIVTDSTNRRVFQGGVDYIVYLQGNVTRIARVRTGRIADGDTIFVDYQYRTPADGKIDTIRVDFDIEQRFDNGWRPYYRFAFRHQEEDVTFGFPGRADRTDHHRLGVKLEKERFRLGAEYEIYDDSVDPYDAYHLDGLVRVVQSPQQSLNATSRVSQFFFENEFDDREVVMVDVGIDHRWQLSRAWSTIGRLAYRWQDDSIEGITRGWDVTTGLEYALGDLTAELTFEYDRLTLPQSLEEDLGLFFRMRRDIRNVFASR